MAAAWHPSYDSFWERHHHRHLLQSHPPLPLPSLPRNDGHDFHHCRQYQQSISLSRPSASVPWGITFSLFDQRMTMLVVVSRKAGDGLQQQQQRKLRAGDCILAVNGRPVSEFGSLQGVTAFMRLALALDLRVLRSAQPASAATTAPPTSSSTDAAAAGGIGRHDPPHYYYYNNHQQISSPMAPATMASSSQAVMSNVVTPPLLLARQPPPLLLRGGAKKRKRLWGEEDGTVVEDPGGEEGDRGTGANLFLYRIDDFGVWLNARKKTWRSKFWRVNGGGALGVSRSDASGSTAYAAGSGTEDHDDSGANRRDDAASYVPANFWSFQGYASFQDWMRTSKLKWSKSYSWNRRKRMRWEADILSSDGISGSSHCRRSFFSPNGGGNCRSSGGSAPWGVDIAYDVHAWLRVRKRQWLILRRKRQRQRQQQQQQQQLLRLAYKQEDASREQPSSLGRASDDDHTSLATAAAPKAPAPAALASSNRELVIIDELLDEEEERNRAAREARPPPDLSFLFDPGHCPDDAVVHVLSYLDLRECGKLLHVCREWRSALIRRDRVWQDLCPKRWTLPRRPRKPWHEIFLRNLRMEAEASQKQWDDLLGNVSQVLERGDCVQQVEKLVGDAERAFGFHVNYTSGVVCERNAILNLAVIHQRHKVARWLVDVKHADIETCDRGHFTPLLNAAWVRSYEFGDPILCPIMSLTPSAELFALVQGGDKYLVRFLLQKGADRSKVGFYHYSKGLSSPGFKGLTAAGWAEKKGFLEVANLIRMGL